MSALHQISVVIPAFNSEGTIGRAIESVRLSEMAVPIVVDDGSSDNTSVAALEKGALLIRQPNRGAARAREAGLQEVRTEFVLFLDADDQLMPGGLESLLRSIDSEHVGAQGAYEVRHPERDSTVHPWPEGVSTRTLLDRAVSPGPPAAFLWRTSLIKQVFGELAPPPLKPAMAEDYEMLIRCSLVGQVASVDQVVCTYNPIGGKSARHPLDGVRSTETTRRYYADHLGLDIRRRSESALRGQAGSRRIYHARTRLGRRLLFVAVMIRHPGFGIMQIAARLTGRGRRK